MSAFEGETHMVTDAQLIAKQVLEEALSSKAEHQDMFERRELLVCFLLLSLAMRSVSTTHVEWNHQSNTMLSGIAFRHVLEALTRLESFLQSGATCIHGERLPPKRRNFTDMVFPAEKTHFPGVHKIGAAISGPRIADTNFTDTRIFLKLLLEGP